jgi:hypothetical protein
MASMHGQKWKYLTAGFTYGVLADRLSSDAIRAFSRPWTGDAGQQGVIFELVLLVVLLGAIAIGRFRQVQRADSD